MGGPGSGRRATGSAKMKYSKNVHVRKSQYGSFGQSNVAGRKELPTFKMGFNIPRKGGK